MDPLIRDQIKSLQASEHPRDHSMATILEVLVEVRDQTQLTNGRVTALEKKHAGVVSCPGKCIDLEVQLIKAIDRVESQEGRLAKLEEPVRVRGAIWRGIVSSFAGVSAVLTVVFGFLYIPGVSDSLFSGRDVAIEQVVSQAVAQEMQRQHAQPPPDKH